jgi:hypothetical protein
MAYQLMTTSGHQILTSRDIIFYETHIKFTQNFIQQDDKVEQDSLFDVNLFQFMIEIPNPQTRSSSVPQNSVQSTQQNQPSIPLPTQSQPPLLN